LRCAAEIFLAQGFEATAYDHIATAAGLSKPSLYNAFGDKTALFERVVDGYAAFAHRRILETFSAGSDIASATRSMLLAAADAYAPADNPSTGCLLVGTALPACTQHAAVQKTLSDFLATLDTDLEAVIAERHASETQRLRRPPRSVALQVSSLLFSLAIHARTGMTRRRLRTLATELAETLTRT
jgi:AcrR family transcriptional regulator